MNIYQKKIVKEKEYIFNEDFVQTKSTYPNSKPDMDCDINSNLNKRQFFGLNSNQIKKKLIISKNNRNHRSKSQILNENNKIEEYIPKEIKTVLIKLNKPIEQNNDEKEKNNSVDKKELKFRTYRNGKFYKKKCNNINKDLKNSIIKKSLNSRDNIINIDISFENNNYNSNFISFLLPYHHHNKHTRNRSAILKNEYFSNTNNSINSSYNTIYKKSFCLDKHKNYGGNFKNKERAKTNPKIKPYKSGNNIKYNKKTIKKNISSSNIDNINLEEIQNLNYEKININKNNSLFQHANTNAYKNINNNCNNANKGNPNDLKNINIQYDLSIMQGDKDKMKTILSKNENENINNINLGIYKNKDDGIFKKNKLKPKNVPPLDFKNKIQNFSNMINIDSNSLLSNNVYNQKFTNRNTNRNQISMTNKKNNTLIFEETINDQYSIRNCSKNKSNLLNLINISEQVSKRNKINYIHKNSELNKVNNYMKKDNEKNKFTIKKNNNYNYNNNKKINKIKAKSKSKGKIFRTNSTKKIDGNNKVYQIKSIPLKLNNNRQNEIHKYFNVYNNLGYNINKKNEIPSNVVFINKKDFSLWNDLARIYDNNGKFQ